jgi:hypothetical protein
MSADEASWELAAIEECRGDARFFTGEAGAAPHYRAACAALFPQGRVWDSREENDRRMEAHRRVTDKLYAIDPYGKAREGQQGQPHPDFRPPEPKPSIAERRAAALALRRDNDIRKTEWAALFRDAGHWQFHELGDKWRDAGDALAGSHADAARRAFAWSLYYFEQYNREWTAHLPASRWDSDGGIEMSEVQQRCDSLAAADDADSLPTWIESLLAGDWRAAQVELGAAAPPEWGPLGALLDEARRAAGLLPTEGRS